MADPFFITSRRRLLIGMSVSVSTRSIFMPHTLVAEPDPACIACLHAQEAENAVNNHRGPEGDYYQSLITVHIAAEHKLAATPSLSLAGVHGKMNRFVINQYWADDDPMLDAILGRSILRDLNRMTT